MNVRPAAVAGTFYPRDEQELRAVVDAMLDAAAAPPPDESPPKALVVPHAGYVYSGPIAATGYRLLVSARDLVRRVVLLGPAHFVAAPVIALSRADEFATPLGRVAIDTELRDRVHALPGVVVDDRPHAPEHSLEVHLPFLQRVLGDFTLLPLVVGRVEPRAVADVLDAVWGGPETLIVVSTDLSHYLDHASARRQDRATVDAVLAGRIGAITPADACGAVPLRGFLVAAAEHHLRGRLLDLRSSGDTAGDRQRVVGYAALSFGSAPAP